MKIWIIYFIYLNNSISPGKIIFRYGEIDNNIYEFPRIFGITNKDSNLENIIITNKTNSDTTIYKSIIQYITKSNHFLY